MSGENRTMTILTADHETRTINDHQFTISVTPRSNNMMSGTRTTDAFDPSPMRHRRVRQTPRHRTRRGAVERVIASHLDDTLPAGDLPEQLLTDLGLSS